MKKRIFGTLLVISLLFVVTSCANGNSDDSKQKDWQETNSTNTRIVDLRNKDSSGNVVSRSVVNPSSPIGTFLEKGGAQSYGGLTDEQLANIISFEDDDNGFKINYTTPESFKTYTLSTRIIYIDGNGKWSTRQNINDNEINENGKVKDSYSWVYPLVLPGKTYKFAIQFQYRGSGNPPDFQLIYEVTPLHGKGIIDDLPSNWESSDYTEFKDAVFSLKNVIPVESSSGVRKSYGLYGTNSATEYWVDFKWVGGGEEQITNDSDAKTINMKNRNYHTNYPYVYCQFFYRYDIEGFDFCNFEAPEFVSKIIRNTDFLN